MRVRDLFLAFLVRDLPLARNDTVCFVFSVPATSGEDIGTTFWPVGLTFWPVGLALGGGSPSMSAKLLLLKAMLVVAFALSEILSVAAFAVSAILLTAPIAVATPR